jgi:nucleoside-diphosphate-sugar epimerase
MTSIAILGANGRLGRAVAKAFLDGGYAVRAVTRSGKLPIGLDGATAFVGDALDAASLIRATQGVDIILSALNPVYSDWSTVLPMARNVIEACRANGAVHFFPGTIYNYGSRLPPVIAEDTPQRPTTEKGRIRVELETLFRREAEAGNVRTVLLRAGDFFGGSGTGAWFDLVTASKVGKGVYTAAGPVNLGHEWAYLPDYAAAFVALADNLDRLTGYEALHFPGHAITELEMKAALEEVLQRKLRLVAMPWWVLRAGSPFVAMWRELVAMSYLRFEPHRLVSNRLESLIGTIPHTPLEKAVFGALRDLDMLPADTGRQAA